MATQTERKSVKSPVFSPAKLADITSAVRAFCVIYNTSLTYDTMHQVFQKAVEERLPVFRAALSGVLELPLFFTDGQIRLGSVPLDPGSGMFQKLSNEFQCMGISSISILPSVSGDDLKKMMKIVVGRSDEIAGLGLQHFLAREGVAGIVENKVKTQVVSKDTSGRSGSPRQAVDGPVTVQGRLPDVQKAWDIDAGSEQAQQAGSKSAPRSVRDFVAGAIGALARSEARVDEVADIIATEFEHRLNEKVEEVRRASDRKIRRLEDIKDLILRELESKGVAAFVIDLHLRILSANGLGREILGDAPVIDRESSLGAFVLSQCERQDVSVNGMARTAHLLTSTSSGGGDSMMLLALE